MNQSYTLKNYQNLLKELDGQENHLLLGNGFNRGLGIDTSYPAIFDKMIANSNGIYRDIRHYVENCNYDLELFIAELVKDIDPNNQFLIKYVTNKVKLDFMQATHEIVRAELKNIYAEKNNGIHILLSNFSNYFTLNYDPFLYLLLLNYKSDTTNLNVTFQSAIKFKEADLNDNHKNIVDEIRNIRNGSMTISVSTDLNPTNTPLNKVTRGVFTAIINQYSKTEKKLWKTKQINEALKVIWEEEKNKKVLNNIDDGAIPLFDIEPIEFIFDTSSKTQNFFFLHGAFHIYQDGKSIKKITQQGEKALYERLEQILQDDNQTLITVFQSHNKKSAINDNAYLKHCFAKLKTLKGNIFILGSALSENDSHIFKEINNSDITNVYIATTSLNVSKIENAISHFPNKTISFIDVNSISYEQPLVEQEVL